MKKEIAIFFILRWEVGNSFIALLLWIGLWLDAKCALKKWQSITLLSRLPAVPWISLYCSSHQNSLPRIRVRRQWCVLYDKQQHRHHHLNFTLTQFPLAQSAVINWSHFSHVSIRWEYRIIALVPSAVRMRRMCIVQTSKVHTRKKKNAWEIFAPTHWQPLARVRFAFGLCWCQHYVARTVVRWCHWCGETYASVTVEWTMA